MHEMSIAVELLRQALEIAGQHQATAIEEIDVEIGVLRQVVPEALELSFRAAAAGSIAEAAVLKLHEEKVVAVCRACGCMFLPKIDDFTCTQCGQADARMVAGNDIILKTMACRVPEGVSIA